MKKIISLLLAMTLVLSLTACGGGKTAETAKDDTEGKTAVDILNDTWAVYEEG
jgi:predicted small lipoprotein YifL